MTCTGEGQEKVNNGYGSARGRRDGCAIILSLRSAIRIFQLASTARFLCFSRSSGNK